MRAGSPKIGWSNKVYFDDDEEEEGTRSKS
jgi:hypothetical protein